MFKIILDMNVRTAEVDAVLLSLCSKMAQGLPGKAGLGVSRATASTITAVLTAKVNLSLE